VAASWLWLWLLAAPAVGAPLDSSRGGFRAEVVETRSLPDRVEYEVRFPSPVRSPFKNNDVVWGHLAVPRRAGRAGRSPCVMVLPVMAAPNVWIEERFMRRFLSDGLAVFWIEMPYQFHRRPQALVPSGQVFLARTAKHLAFNFRQSVLDARRALDWLSSRPDIDPARIGLFGVSLGAMVGAVLDCVDSRPKYAVFLLAGADFPGLVASSSMTRRFVQRAGITEESLRAAWKGLDPLDYRKGNAGKKVLLVNVRSDSVVPAANALKLKEAFPESRQVWLPFGHYSALLHLLWIPRVISRNLLANL